MLWNLGFISIECAFLNLSTQQHLCVDQIVHAVESGTAELSITLYQLLACIAPSACPCSVFPHFLLDESEQGWWRINKQRYPVQNLLLSFLVLESRALVFGTEQWTCVGQLYLLTPLCFMVKHFWQPCLRTAHVVRAKLSWVRCWAG